MTVRQDLMKRSACSSVSRSELAQSERSSPDSSPAAAADSDVPSNVLADVLADVLATPTPPASQPAPRAAATKDRTAPTATVQIQRESAWDDRKSERSAHRPRIAAHRLAAHDHAIPTTSRQTEAPSQHSVAVCAADVPTSVPRTATTPRLAGHGEVSHRLDRPLDRRLCPQLGPMSQRVIRTAHRQAARCPPARSGRDDRETKPALHVQRSEARCAHAAALHHRDRHLDASFQKEPDQDCCRAAPQAQGVAHTCHRSDSPKGPLYGRSDTPTVPCRENLS